VNMNGVVQPLEFRAFCNKHSLGFKP
jgi:hypothetical protein